MRRLSFLTVFLFSFNCQAETTDSTTEKNLFLVSINYPLPTSAITFQTTYTGVFNVRGEFERLVYERFSLGVGADYSYFQTSNQVLDIKTKMNIISPSFSIGFQTVAFKKVFIHPVLSGGYSFISFSGTGTEGSTKPKFNEQGSFVLSSLYLGYLLSNKISVGLNSSYKIIFQHFGSNATLEDSNIRIADIGIGVTYKP